MEGGTTAVKGELWSIHSARAYLDEYEDVPVDYVERRLRWLEVHTHTPIFMSVHSSMLSATSGDWGKIATNLFTNQDGVRLSKKNCKIGVERIYPKNHHEHWGRSMSRVYLFALKFLFGVPNI